MPDDADPVDRLVGARLRERREALGITQAALAGALSVSFQQVQKYEKGTNRITAARLAAAAQALKVTPAYFFAQPAPQASPVLLDFPASVLASEDARRLNEAFWKIKDAALRRQIIALVAKVAGATRMDGFDKADAVLAGRPNAP